MRPDLAANLSPALLQLIDEEPPCVDAVKVSEFGDPEYVDECRRLAPRKRLVFHGICQMTDWGRVRAPSIGNPGFRESIDLSALQAALDIAHPDYISVHLELIGDTIDPEQYLSLLASDADFTRTLTGLPVHLENTYLLHGQERRHDTDFVSDPMFIRRALSVTGSRFLLDVAHAQVAAWHKGLPVLEYLDALPPDLVDEVHVCAPAMVNGQLRDRHVEMSDTEYRLLEHVLTRCSVKTVSLEYGGFGPLFQGKSSLGVLKEQLVTLAGILNGVSGYRIVGNASLGG
ncbi:MAG: DUF692 family multinuclear iron-containing protein [Bacillota bacterium]